MIFSNAVFIGGYMGKSEVEKPKRAWTAGRPSKPVIATNGWGKETWFPSGREAARKLGIQQSGVTYVLAGQRKKAGGYQFRYADDE